MRIITVVLAGAVAATSLASGGVAAPASAELPAADQADCWDWDRVGNGPTRRLVSDRQAAFHEELGVAVMITGRWSGAARFDETWTWDGASWSRLDVAPIEPFTAFPTMTYDAARGEVVLFGGMRSGLGVDRTWVWDGGEWEQRFPEHAPTPRYGHAMAYDPVREKVVLFGGNSDDLDTWTWDGTDWERLDTTGGPAEEYATKMAFDPVSQTMLLTGGWAGVRETWRLDGLDWTLVDVADTPVAEWRSIATVGEHVVLVGQDRVAGGKATTSWVWDGDDWEPLPARGPAQRRDPVLVYDPGLDRAVVFGGIAEDLTDRGRKWRRDTWLLTPPTR